MDCVLLRKRFDMTKTDRSNIEGVWDLIEKYVVPFRGKFFSDENEGQINWRRRYIYDSTAVVSAQSLASNMHSGLTNSSYRWFDFQFRNKELNKNDEARTWLSTCADIVFMTLQESNFNLEANETYLDLASFGTSVIVEEVEETPEKSFKELAFSAVPVSEAYFEQDYKGQVAYFYRKLNWTPVQIVSKFGKQNVPEKIVEKAEKGTSSDSTEEVIFAIYPRKEFANADTSSVLPPEKRPFGYKYFLYKDAEQLGKEGGYYEMPAFIPRWRKTTGSMWGHSPAMVSLSDILTLNQLVELILKAAEKVVDPPTITTRRGVFGDIDLEAGGLTVVADMKAIAPFESKARFDVSDLQKRELQQAIREAFYMDQLQLKESPAMTATEVQARFELMARLLGPTLGRLQSDFLDPLVQRTFRILFRYKQLPPTPQVVRESQSEMDIEYLGPMARAQKMDKVTSIERWMANIAQAAEAFPEMLDVPEPTEAAREMALYLAVPPEIVRSKDKVTTIQKLKKQVTELRQQLEMMKEGSEALKNAGQGMAALGGGNGGGAEAVRSGLRATG